MPSRRGQRSEPLALRNSDTDAPTAGALGPRSRGPPAAGIPARSALLRRRGGRVAQASTPPRSGTDGALRGSPPGRRTTGPPPHGSGPSAGSRARLRPRLHHHHRSPRPTIRGPGGAARSGDGSRRARRRDPATSSRGRARQASAAPEVEVVEVLRRMPAGGGVPGARRGHRFDRLYRQRHRVGVLDVPRDGPGPRSRVAGPPQQIFEGLGRRLAARRWHVRPCG